MSEPIAKSILACCYFVKDERGRFTLVNIFDQITSPAPPMEFFLYLTIADVPPEGVLLIQVEDQSSLVLWSSGKVPFKLDDPTTPIMNGVQKIGPVMFGHFKNVRVAVYIGSMRVGDLVIRGADASKQADKI